VSICGRNEDKLNDALASLAERHSPENIFGIQGDVRDYQQLKTLWEKTKEKFNQVDIWINNAGIAQPRYAVWEQKPELIKQVIDTNLTGAIFECKVAIEGMLKQGFGAVYNLEGSGSSGTKLTNFALYGTTKYALRFLTESLVQETKNILSLVNL
jgi:NADP-dependent 3-hydroxy acid dehydrogenase YdfG